ncbi:hypothetical protein BSKO_13176 [Bryopsis sp. KO-2023]|nr:hypothetical protein BSKO_13176 [Bryopsis sp. KO-2023]
MKRRTPDKSEYTSLENEDSEGDDCLSIAQNKTPWRSVLLAFGLLIVGVAFFSLSLLHTFGHFFSKKGAGWGFFVLGVLTFLPGFYHSRIAYYAWRRREGYSLASIPSF